MYLDLAILTLFAVQAALSDEIPLTKTGHSYAPAMVYSSEGTRWIAWQTFDPASSSTTILMCAEQEGGQTEPTPITSAPGDILGPKLAASPDGTLWIVWAEQRGAAWDIYAKRFKDGTLSPEMRITDDGGSFAPAVAAGKNGSLWVAWQSRRDGNFKIFVRSYASGDWSETACVSENPSSNHKPDVAVDSSGRLWVGWDTFRNGNYDIYLRHTIDTDVLSWSEPIRVTAAMDYDMLPSLGIDSEDNVWVAWIRSPIWGRSDYRLHVGKRLMLRQYLPSTGQFRQPQTDRRDLDGMVPLPVDSRERVIPTTPSLVLGLDGAAHLLYRKFRDHGANDWGWNVALSSYVGDQWLPEVTVSSEPGFTMSEPSTLCDASGDLWIAYQACAYSGGRKPVDDTASNIYVRRISVRADQAPVLTQAVLPAPKHLEEFEVGRSRPEQRPSLVREDSRYQLLWGDLHRHSTLSKCVPERDGTLWDHYRWALDVAALDFYATTDHTEQTSPYETRKAQAWADLFHNAPEFITLYGCEQNFRDTEHTNFLYADRSLTPIIRESRLKNSRLPDAIEMLDANGMQGKVLIARHFHGDGFGNKHETAPPFDPRYECVMEAVQTRGFSPTTVEHYLSLGVRAGLIGGSDHSRSPGGPGGPWAYPYALTGVWAEEASRDGVWDALFSGRCFATNGKKIQAVLESDGHFMGEEYETDSAPLIQIRATATTHVCQVELVRNGHAIPLDTELGSSVNVKYQEEALEPGDYYYYARITQEREGDDNYRGVAVTTPVWISVR